MWISIIRQRIRLLILFIATTISVGCIDYKPTLRVAVSPWLGFEPIYLAQRLGYQDQARFQLAELTTSTHVLHALKSNQVDAAFVSLPEAVSLVSAGMQLCIIAVVDQSLGGDALIAQQGHIDSQSLLGKRVGYESQSMASLVLDDWLTSSGHQVEDFILVEAKQDEQLELFRQGEIEAVIATGPLLRRLQENLSANVIYQGEQLEQSYYRVLVVSNELSEDAKDQVGELVDSYFRASNWLQTHPREGFKLIAKRNQLYSSEVSDAFEQISLLNKRESRRVMEQQLTTHTLELGERMVKLGLISTLPDFSKAIETRWLEEAPDA